VGGEYRMNGEGESSTELSCLTIRGKGTTWKNYRRREHTGIDRLIDKKKDKKNFNL
jgi:hypothetical protein